LGRRIQTRKTKNYAVRKKEVAVLSVVKFTAIVTLNKTNSKTEVRKYILAKASKDSVYIRLGMKRECPDIMRIIIQNYSIIFITRDTWNWRGPEITMK
jgi:hypothetical protein